MSVVKPKSLAQLMNADKKALQTTANMRILFPNWTDKEDMTREQFFRGIAEKCAEYVDNEVYKKQLSIFMFIHGPLHCKVKPSDREDFHDYSEDDLKAMRANIRAFSGDSIYGLLTDVVFPLQTADKVYSFVPGQSRHNTEYTFWSKVAKLVKPDQPPVDQAASLAVPDAPVVSKEQKATDLLAAFTREVLQNDAISTPVAAHAASKQFLTKIAGLGGFDTLTPEQVLALTQQWAIKITQVIVPPGIEPAKENRNDAKDLLDVITHFQDTSYDSFAKNVFPLQTTNHVKYSLFSAMGLADAIQKVFRQIVDQMCKDKTERRAPPPMAARRVSTGKAAQPDSMGKAHQACLAPVPYTFPLNDEYSRDLFMRYWSKSFHDCTGWHEMLVVWGKFYDMCTTHFTDLSSKARKTGNTDLVRELLNVFVATASALVKSEGHTRLSPPNVQALCRNLRENCLQNDMRAMLSAVFPRKANPTTGIIQFVGIVDLPLVVNDLLFALECRIVHMQQEDAKRLAEEARVPQSSKKVTAPPPEKAGKASKGPVPADAPMPTPQAREPPRATPASLSKGPVRTQETGGNIHLRFPSSESEEDEQEPVDAAPPAPKKLKPSPAEPVKASSGKGGGPKRAGPKAPALPPAVERDEVEAPKAPSMGFTLAHIPANVDTTVCTLAELLELGKARIRYAALSLNADAADPYPDGKDGKTLVESALARPRRHAPSSSDDDE